MIEFLDQPYRATNTNTGFEILIHGFILRPARAEGGGIEERLFALCISEEGVFHEIAVAEGSLATDWRYDRKGNQGWITLTPVADLE